LEGISLLISYWKKGQVCGWKMQLMLVATRIGCPPFGARSNHPDEVTASHQGRQPLQRKEVGGPKTLRTWATGRSNARQLLFKYFPAAGEDFHGFCWPGPSVYPDFCSPEARAEWAKLFDFKAPLKRATATRGISYSWIHH